MNSTGRSAADAPREGLTATVETLTLPKGLYFFRVRAAAPERVTAAENLTLPALHVAAGPGIPADRIEFMPGPQTNGNWLCEPGDMLVAKVGDAPATVLLTSFRASGTQPLEIELDRLDTWNMTTVGEGEPPQPPASEREPNAPPGLAQHKIPLRIATHIRNRGDVAFVEADWAGRVGAGHWIEAFAVMPLEEAASAAIEYKGLTASGVETPWLEPGMPCGTRGMNVPLVGFAVRPKPGAAAALYDCEYSGHFQNGGTLGPVRNGQPCRSPAANDPLEGLQIRITGPQSAAISQANRPIAEAAPARSTSAEIGAPQPTVPQPPPAAPRNPEQHGVRLQIDVHVSNRGDVRFVDADWAGRLGQGVSLEAFSVTPLEDIPPAEVEYKGLAASGFETPWISGGASCGTRGMGLPLIGFAMRSKPGAAAARYDFVYRGYFQSGAVAGPFRNGAPCRSSVPNDPLEGIELRVEERQRSAAPLSARSTERLQPAETGGTAPLGPRFSKFREDDQPPSSAGADVVVDIARPTPARLVKPARSQKGRRGSAPRTAPPRA